MGLPLVGQMMEAVRGLDILGWVRNIEASDADPALTVKQSGANSIGARLMAGSPSAVPFRVDGALGQSGNLIEVRRSTGTILIRVTGNGSLYVLDGGGSLLVGFNSDNGSPPEQLYVSPYSSSVVGQKVKGQPGQTADLQRWVDSSDTVLSRIDNVGTIISTVGVRTKHEGVATPTGGASGEVRLGDGKIWVNDSGTWKSVAVA